MSREELRAQRRLRSSSEGAVERSRLDRVRAEKESPAASQRKKERRSRSTSVSEKDRKCDRSSSRPRSDRTHRKGGETHEDEKSRKSSWWNLDAKEGESHDLGHRIGPSLNSSGNAGDVSTRSVKQSRRLSMTSSNGAEIPPGFPAAAVDHSVRTLQVAELESTGGAEGASELKNANVLESTTKIRERRASVSGATGVAATVMTTTSVDIGADRLRRRKRQISAGNGVSTVTEKELINPPSPRLGEKIKRPLRQSMSENQKSPIRKPTRRSRSAELLSPERKSSRKSVPSSRNERLPLAPTQLSVEKSPTADPAESSSRKKDDVSQRDEKRDSSKRLESISPGRRRRKSILDVKHADNHSSRRDAQSEIVKNTGLASLPIQKEEKLSRRSRSADSVSSTRSKTTIHGADMSPTKKRSAVGDECTTEKRVDARTTRVEARVRSKSPTKVRPKLSSDLSGNLSKVNDKRTSNKPTAKKGSGQSVSSAPAMSTKNAKEKRRSLKKDDMVLKGAKLKTNSVESPTDISVSDLKPENYDGSTADRFHGSMASLDPMLLLSSPAAHKVSSISEIYLDNLDGADNASHGKTDDLKNQKSIGTLFRENHGTVSKFNQSTLSFESRQVENMAAAFGAVSHVSSPSSCESPGVLKRSTGSSPSSTSKCDKRVSWVELPLHDPNQLLLKSADVDGGNETCITQPIEQLSGQAQYLDPLPFERDEKSKEKPNLSLEAAFSREEAIGRRRGSRDERTVGTNATSNTGTTDTSESTVKTTNMNPSLRTIFNGSKTKEHSKVEDVDLHDGHVSLTTNELPTNDASEGSSGSLSGTSRRSKGELTDGSSSTLSERRKTRRLPSRSHSESAAKNKDKSRRKGGDAGDSAKPKRPDRREKPIDGNGKLDSSTPDRREKPDDGIGKLDICDRSLKAVDSKEKSSQMTAGGKIKFMPKGSGNDSQWSGEPTEENSNDDGDDSKDVRPIVKRISSIESDNMSLNSRRRKSYLPRKISKCEMDESKGHKTSINSSLDKFLSKIGDSSPVVKDDNRSVYSAIQDKDRWKRARDKKLGEKLAARGVSRHGVLKRDSELQRTFSDSSDSMSVISAPTLTSSMPSPNIQDERHRPVVDLKKTQFSSKLNKLKVAF
jgi:hypothetical protein